jgi:hypothetical protein
MIWKLFPNICLLRYHKQLPFRCGVVSSIMPLSLYFLALSLAFARITVALPQPEASVAPSSCIYTITSEAGVTATGYYTIQPTVATMCICNSTVMAGIKTVPGTSSTSYLVCAVSGQFTISTMGPAVASTALTTTTTTAPTPVTTKSADEEACENHYKNAPCDPDPSIGNLCRQNACLGYPSCTAAGIICDYIT